MNNQQKKRKAECDRLLKSVREAERLGLTANEFCFKYGYTQHRLYMFRRSNTTTLNNLKKGKQVRKITDFADIRKMLASGFSVPLVCEKLGCSTHTVYKVKKRMEAGEPCPFQKSLSKPEPSGKRVVKSANIQTTANPLLLKGWV